MSAHDLDFVLTCQAHTQGLDQQATVADYHHLDTRHYLHLRRRSTRSSVVGRSVLTLADRGPTLRGGSHVVVDGSACLGGSSPTYGAATAVGCTPLPGNDQAKTLVAVLVHRSVAGRVVDGLT